jgi:hypothetical protein
MRLSHVCLRLLAYSKASLLRSLEGLTQDDLLWQPAKGKNGIGWNAGHVGQFQSSLLWGFDEEPDWSCVGPLLTFGYGSDPEQTRCAIPPKARLIELIHHDWTQVLTRLSQFTDEQFEGQVPLRNPDGETLFEMLHRISWHADHHVGRISALRAAIGKPLFPRPTFGTAARRVLTATSESGWERILASLDEPAQSTMA